MTGSTSSSVFLAFRPDREFRSESAFCSAESDESLLILRRRKPLCFGWSWTLMDELLNCSFCVSETWMKTMRRRGWWWQSGIAIGLPGRSCLNEFKNIISRKSKWCWVTSSVPGQRKWSDQLILIHEEFIPSSEIPCLLFLNVWLCPQAHWFPGLYEFWCPLSHHIIQGKYCAVNELMLDAYLLMMHFPQCFDNDLFKYPHTLKKE